MQGYHWLFLIIVLVVGMLLQAYFDPLGWVGLG